MANRIQKVLRQRRLDQAFIAKEIGVSPAMLSRWCKNISQPSWEQLQLLANCLFTEVNTLVYHNPISAGFRRGDKYNLGAFGVTDLYLKLATYPKGINGLSQLTVWIETNYHDGSRYKYPIPLTEKISPNQNPQISAVYIDETVDNAEGSFLWIDGIEENESVDLVIIRPVNNSERRICPKCGGFGNIILGSGSGFFMPEETPVETTTCDMCLGHGFIEVEFNAMNEMLFARNGFHNHHISFRTTESDELLTGVVFDSGKYDSEKNQPEYTFVPSENLRKYLDEQRGGNHKELEKLGRRIDISTISWAKRLHHELI